MQTRFLCAHSLQAHEPIETSTRKNTPKTHLFRLRYRPPPKHSSLPLQPQPQIPDQVSIQSIQEIHKGFPSTPLKNLHMINRYRMLKKSIDSIYKSDTYWILEGDPICRAKLLSIQKITYPLKNIRDKVKEMNLTQHLKQKRTSLNTRQTSALLTLEEVTARPDTKTTFSNTLSLQSTITVRKPRTKKNHFVFGMSQRMAPTENKVQAYRDFLWKVGYSHGLYVQTPVQSIMYTFHVGEGNNASLIKGVLRRRFWWGTAEKQQTPHFLWTQLKSNQFFIKQTSKRTHQMAANSNPYLVDTKEMQNDPMSKILNRVDYQHWRLHWIKNQKTQKLMNHATYQKRINLLALKPITVIANPSDSFTHNHLPNNQFIGNKKALFFNVSRYCDLLNRKSEGILNIEIIPLTFHLSSTNGPQFDKFIQQFNKLQQQKNKKFRNLWIMKPGENTNRGNGITVCHSLDEIQTRLRGREKNSDGNYRTFILQKYIQNPFLYNKRKFDIRHYVLATCFNGLMKIYWYEEGYIRTSSTEFTLRPSYGNQANSIHLTNDAIQKNMPDYGKYEKGNKVSYEEFERYLHGDGKQKGKKFNFYTQVLPKMKQQAEHAFKSAYMQLDPMKKQNNFQLFGLDFMIDHQFKPWLIEVNSNPSLQLCCPLVSKIIPTLIENTFRLTIDVLFPPPQTWPISKKPFFSQDPLSQNKFSLIFDQQIDGNPIQQLFKGEQMKIVQIQQDTQVFQNDELQDWQDEDL